MTLYHVTFQNRVSKILYHGIMFYKKSTWRGGFYGKIGRSDVIYAWDNWDRAYKWAYKQWWDFGYKPTAIIEFSVNKEYVNKLETMIGDEYLVEINIPPEQIKDVYMFEWIKRR